MKRTVVAWWVAAMVLLTGAVFAQEEAEGEGFGAELQEVESSAIKAIGYDEEMEVLTVEFISGDIYEYSDVPADVYEAFMAAESKGTFFQENIRGRYEFRKK